MTARVILLAAILLAAPALVSPVLAQSPAAPPGSAPEVQAPVPEVGAGRGAQTPAAGSATAPPPAFTGPQEPTPAQAPAQPIPPQATTPVPPLPAPRPLAAQQGISAAELELQAALRGERIEGRISIPDSQAAILVQPEGRDWRRFHNVTLTWVGGVAVLGMLALLAAFYLFRGRIRPESGFSGRTMLRFNWFERGVHWMTAGSFVVLALSGLNLTFGRWLLLPLVGPETFTAISQAGKIAHNYLSFPFALGILLMLVVWVRDNIPERLDWQWVKAGGGFLGGHHPPARRFNAGQKVVFWITVLGGALVSVSGYLLMFPFAVTDVWGMQVSHIVHGVLSVLMIGAMLAHVYIGSLGMEGAFSAMGSGQVDYNWAKEHHALWVEEEVQKARVTLEPDLRARPAGAD